MLEDGDVLRMIRRRMGLGDTLGALPPECGGTGTTEGFDLGKVYPVGSIYMSTAATNPGTLFGGKWEQVKGRFLLAADETYKAGSTGGEAAHKLTVDEMPAHNHKVINATGVVEQSSNRSCLGASQRYSTDYSFSAANSGNDKPHNNMPPYLAVYMWKRTA